MTEEKKNASCSTRDVVLCLVIGIIIFLAIIACLESTIWSDTPYQNFNLMVNDTVKIPYKVHNYGGITELSNWIEYPRMFGYMILSTNTPGKYHMEVTTDKPDDIVGLQWQETFRQHNLVGDKFEKHYEEVTMSQGPWLLNNKCISNRYADCSVNIEQGNYGSTSELQIYILGHGMGTITITRTG